MTTSRKDKTRIRHNRILDRAIEPGIITLARSKEIKLLYKHNYNLGREVMRGITKRIIRVGSKKTP